MVDVEEGVEVDLVVVVAEAVVEDVAGLVAVDAGVAGVPEGEGADEVVEVEEGVDQVNPTLISSSSRIINYKLLN